MIERERERERKEKQPFSGDFTGFCRSELAGRDLKLFHVARVTRGYRNHKISPRSKVRVFMETEKKMVSREITLIEVGFLSYLV